MSHPSFNADETTAAAFAADASTALLRQRVSNLETAVNQLLLSTERIVAAGRRSADLQSGVDGMAATAAQVPQLRQTLGTLTAAVTALEASPTGTGTVPQPPIRDVRSQLPAHVANRYPVRDTGQIGRVVVHHTVTRGDILPERIAQVQVAQGKAGITYHFMITGDGTIYWTQALEVVVEQMLTPAANAPSLAVALAGNFTDQPPPAAQLSSAAALIAWLLTTLHLAADVVVGRKEIETAHGSPGKQWAQGANYKAALLQQVQSILDSVGGSHDDDTDVQRLQARVRELEATVALLQPLADQVAAAQAQVATLQDTLTQRDARIRQLEAEIAQLKGTTGGGVAAPPLRDLVDQLEKHPTLPPYPARTKPISLIVIHHTDTPTTFTPQKIAHYHVNGERKNSQGKIIKAKWPGIGYHFLVGADGTIYQCQREETKSNHVGGEPNNTSVAVSFIGRFMKTNLQGKPALPEDQLPTEPQLRSAAQLVAWLMQKYNIPLDKVMGHRDVWVGATACPGDQWLSGARWKGMLQAAVRAAIEGTPAPASKPLDHYVLFWDHGSNWASDDYRNAQDYIAHFRPTTGFALENAMAARHVTIVGGELGVTAAEEARLRAAGCVVHRLAGADEADTRAKLAALIASNTPWPGAPPAVPTPLMPWDQVTPEADDSAPLEDEWTVPADWWTSEAEPMVPEPAIDDGVAAEVEVGPILTLDAEILVPGAEEVFNGVMSTANALEDTPDHTEGLDSHELPAPATIATLGSGMKARQQERARKAKK